MAEVHSVPKTAWLARTSLVARRTLTDALRARLSRLLAVAGAALVLLALALRDFNFGAAEPRFLADFGLGVISLGGTLFAALVMAHVFFRDLDSGLAALVLTRRVRRGEYLAGKLAGVLALLALFIALLGTELAVIILVREAQLGVTLVPGSRLLQACALVWLKVSLVAAMTLLVCSYAGTALFAAVAGLMLAAAAHLRPFAAATGAMAWLRVWPNLGLFDAEGLLAGNVIGGPALLGLLGYWAVYLGLFGGLAAYVFRRREF